MRFPFADRHTTKRDEHVMGTNASREAATPVDRCVHQVARMASRELVRVQTNNLDTECRMRMLNALWHAHAQRAPT